MARPLSRRGFLGATAGLLAVRPSFASPQLLAAPDVFPVDFRQPPPVRKAAATHSAGFRRFRVRASSRRVAYFTQPLGRLWPASSAGERIPGR